MILPLPTSVFKKIYYYYFLWLYFSNGDQNDLFFWQKFVAQRGARTHDPEIKSLMLYRLS